MTGRGSKSGGANNGGGSNHRGGGGSNGGGPRGEDRRPGRGGADAPEADPVDVHDPDGVRLQKVLASAGLGSRRACEVMIAEGRISVDGNLVTEVGVRIDPTSAQVSVDGLPLQLDTSRIYLALNKPRGVVSTMDDPEGRPSLAQFVEHRRDRLFHVGRLDADTEGLILLTNDGDMAHRLQHPSYEVPKTYLAEVLVSGGHGGGVPQGIGARMRAGIELEDGVVTADSFRLIDSQPGRALVEVVVHEGRKHVVRRMLTEVGLPVQRLVRVQLGPVHLGDLRPGAKRALNREEIGLLRGRGTSTRAKETKRGNGGRERAARPMSDR